MRISVRIGASLIRASLFLEQLERRAQRLGSMPGWAVKRIVRPWKVVRNDLVLMLSSEAALVEFCSRAYAASPVFKPESAKSIRGLWEWEKAAVEKFFPPPPARILIGGAGDGREAFALAALGYSAVAFELSPGLASSGAQRAAAGSGVQFFRAAYEDLPALGATDPGSSGTTTTELGPFDAAIVGWMSYMYMITRERRVRALREIARVTRGPVLITTCPRTQYDGTPTKPRWLRRLFPMGLARDPGNAFLPGPGFHHQFDESEFAAELRDAGLEIVHMHFPLVWNDRTDSPIAIARAVGITAR